MSTTLSSFLIFSVLSGAAASTPPRLEDAIREQDQQALDQVLQSGIDIHTPDRNGQTPLHWVARQGWRTGAYLLLAHGADPAARDRQDRTPLHLAANHGHAGIVELLLSVGADPNLRDWTGRTPLFIAVLYKHPDVARLLLAAHANPNAPDNRLNTPLHAAALNDDDNMIDLLESSGADVNAADNQGNTPLHRALDKGSFTAARHLIKRGADVNLRNMMGRTPALEDLRQHSHAHAPWSAPQPAQPAMTLQDHPGGSIVSQYHDDSVPGLRRPAQKPVPDFETQSSQRHAGRPAASTEHKTQTPCPLHQAVAEGYAQLVHQLLDEGADVTALDSFGDTPLHVAVAQHCAAIAELLIDYGAPVDLPDATGQTPLHIAALTGDAELVDVLVAAGADLTARNDLQHTPLHLAAMAGERQAAALLLEHGAAIDADANGMTPLAFSLLGGHEQLAVDLVERGAEINLILTDDCVTPLHLAVERDMQELGEVLMALGADLDTTQKMKADSSKWAGDSTEEGSPLGQDPYAESETATHFAQDTMPAEETSTAVRLAGALAEQDDQEVLDTGEAPHGAFNTHPDSNFDFEAVAQDTLEAAPVIDTVQESAPNPVLENGPEFEFGAPTEPAVDAAPVVDTVQHAVSDAVREGENDSGSALAMGHTDEHEVVSRSGTVAEPETTPTSGQDAPVTSALSGMGLLAFAFGAAPLAIAIFMIASVWCVFSKAGEPGWACLVPIYNAVVLFRIAGKPGWWLLLAFLPVVNLIIMLLTFVGLARNFDKGVGFGLGLMFFGPIFYPILAFGKAQYNPAAAYG